MWRIYPLQLHLQQCKTGFLPLTVSSNHRITSYFWSWRYYRLLTAFRYPFDSIYIIFYLNEKAGIFKSADDAFIVKEYISVSSHIQIVNCLTKIYEGMKVMDSRWLLNRRPLLPFSSLYIYSHSPMCCPCTQICHAVG